MERRAVSGGGSAPFSRTDVYGTQDIDVYHVVVIIPSVLNYYC